MANTFITPSVIARTGLATLYNTIVLAQLVSRDFDGDFTGKQGDTITVRKPAIFTATEFDDSTGTTLQDATEDSTTVVLNKIADVSFAVTSKQMTLTIVDFAEQLLNPAMMAVAQKVDADIAETIIDASNDAGGGGEAEMTTVASDALIDARTILSRNKFPVTERYAVLGPEAVGEALHDELFVQANKSGSTDALREANIGRVFGMDTYETQAFGDAVAGLRGQADGAAFHRSAVVLAMRQLANPMGLNASQYAQESFKSLSLRVTYTYNQKYKRDEVSVDTLYGVAKTRVAGAIELDFGIGS